MKTFLTITITAAIGAAAFFYFASAGYSRAEVCLVVIDHKVNPILVCGDDNGPMDEYSEEDREMLRNL